MANSGIVDLVHDEEGFEKDMKAAIAASLAMQSRPSAGTCQNPDALCYSLSTCLHEGGSPGMPIVRNTISSFEHVPSVLGASADAVWC